MNENKCYRLAEKDYMNFDGYQHRIFWNVEAIANKPKACGYIVQKVDANTTSPQIIMEKRPYYEAWHVVDGSTGNSGYDDQFWAQWLDKGGKATYQTKVYWIDKEDELYSIVNGWKRGMVKMACDLPSAYEFHEIESRTPVCTRCFCWNSEDY